MNNVERSVMHALLDVLKDKNLISERIFEKAGETISSTLDWTDFFEYDEADEDHRKGEADGST